MANRSFELIKYRQYNSALQKAKRAQSFQPNDQLKGAILYNLGRAYEGLSDHKEAKVMYESFLKARPHNRVTSQRLKSHSLTY